MVFDFKTLSACVLAVLYCFQISSNPSRAALAKSAERG